MEITSLALLIPIFGIFFGSLLPIVLVWMILHYKAQKHDRLCQTALKLAERGQPIPPEFFQTPGEGRSDLRVGLVLSLLGIGLSIGLHDVGAPWTFGLIPALMGVGYLLVWKIDSARPKTGG